MNARDDDRFGFEMDTNHREVSDSVYLFVTSGGRLGLGVGQEDDTTATTFLTPLEWRLLRAQADRLVAEIE